MTELTKQFIVSEQGLEVIYSNGLKGIIIGIVESITQPEPKFLIKVNR